MGLDLGSLHERVTRNSLAVSVSRLTLTERLMQK